MNELHTAISDALINTCYGYETSDYINLLEKDQYAELTETNRKALDTLLSCTGLAVSLHVIHFQYGDKSNTFIADLLKRLCSRLAEAGLPSEALTLQIELINNSFAIVNRELTSRDEQASADVTTQLIKPLSGSFDNINTQSERLHLWLMTFITDMKQLSEVVLKNANEKYDFTL